MKFKNCCTLLFSLTLIRYFIIKIIAIWSLSTQLLEGRQHLIHVGSIIRIWVGTAKGKLKELCNSFLILGSMNHRVYYLKKSIDAIAKGFLNHLTQTDGKSILFCNLGWPSFCQELHHYNPKAEDIYFCCGLPHICKF